MLRHILKDIEESSLGKNFIFRKDDIELIVIKKDDYQYHLKSLIDGAGSQNIVTIEMLEKIFKDTLFLGS